MVDVERFSQFPQTGKKARDNGGIDDLINLVKVYCFFVRDIKPSLLCIYDKLLLGLAIVPTDGARFKKIEFSFGGCAEACSARAGFLAKISTYRPGLIVLPLNLSNEF